MSSPQGDLDWGNNQFYVKMDNSFQRGLRIKMSHHLCPCGCICWWDLPQSCYLWGCPPRYKLYLSYILFIEQQRHSSKHIELLDCLCCSLSTNCKSILGLLTNNVRNNSYFKTANLVRLGYFKEAGWHCSTYPLLSTHCFQSSATIPWGQYCETDYGHLFRHVWWYIMHADI